MNFVTRSEFREVLLALFNDIQHLRKEVRNSAQGQHANRKPQEPVFTITKIDPISSIETHTPVSEQTTQKNYHFWSLVTQWSTFGIVALYTTVAALQWCAVKEANKIARDSLEAQTRPWIGIPKIELTEQKDTGSVDHPRLHWTFFINMQNYGHSPAKQVAITTDSMFGHGVPWQSWDTCKSAEQKSIGNIQTKVVFPTDVPREGEFGADFAISPSAPMGKYLIVCIAYQGITGNMHHTKIVYNGVPEDPEQRNFFPAKLRIRDVQAD